jgi:hypothetical protein
MCNGRRKSAERRSRLGAHITGGIEEGLLFASIAVVAAAMLDHVVNTVSKARQE